MKDIGTQAKNTLKAIEDFVSPIRLNFLGCDGAMKSMRESLADIAKTPPTPMRSYDDCLLEMNKVAKSLVSSLNFLVTTAQSKPFEVVSASNKVAMAVSQLVEVTRLAVAASTEADVSKQKLQDGIREVINAALNVVNDAKLASADHKNPQLIAAIIASFKNVTTVVGQSLPSANATPTPPEGHTSNYNDLSPDLEPSSPGLCLAPPNPSVPSPKPSSSLLKSGMIQSSQIEYNTGHMLGAGSQGVVYRARWNSRDVVLKLLHIRQDADEKQEFLRESEVWRCE
jgi:hypothetical protein